MSAIQANGSGVFLHPPGVQVVELGNSSVQRAERVVLVRGPERDQRAAAATDGRVPCHLRQVPVAAQGQGDVYVRRWRHAHDARVRALLVLAARKFIPLSREVWTSVTFGFCRAPTCRSACSIRSTTR